MSEQCRVCLNFGECFTSLFANSDDGATLSQIIQCCADVQITEDEELPSHVCSGCCEEAKRAYRFVRKCRQSDSELREQQIRKKLKKSPTADAPISPLGIDESRTEQLKVELVLPSNIKALEDRVDPETDGCYSVEYLDEGCLMSDNEEEVSSNNLECNESSTDTSVHHCCFGDCLSMFVTKETLKDHIHSEHLPNDDGEIQLDANYRCENCGRLFTTPEELTLHEMLLNMKRSIFLPCAKGAAKMHRSIFTSSVKKCCDCYASFLTTTDLLAHTMQRHSIRQTVQDPGRPVRCEICFKLFRCVTSLRKHQRAAYKPRDHGCTVCGASYSTPSQLAIHERLHTVERTLVCDVCGASFKKEQNLKMHSLLHRDKREVCLVCGLRFHRKSNLWMHERVHSDAYYSVCTLCGKQYKNGSQLKEHMKVHTKEKPIECRYCPKRFGYSSDRKRHEMTHTGQYPFVCDCSKKFSRRALYIRHTGKCDVGERAN